MNKKFLEILLFSATFFAFPVFAKAEIRINEVAWMGTSGSQYEEWIELYNDGATQALDSWKIYKAGGGTVLINLSGSISGGAHLLVCRTTASVPNPLSGTCDIKGAFGGSGLNNTSEHIVLKNGSESTMDEINASSGWPAGDSASKHTMQKYNSSWITASATPRAANATTGSGGNNGDNNSEIEDYEEEETDNVTSENVPEIKIYSNRILKVEYPKIVVSRSPAHFRAQALDYDRSDLFKGHYTWNMGDGTIREFALGFRETNEGFYHSYDYPGTYTVNVKYFTGFLKDVPAELEETFVIEVGTATVSISKVYPDGAVELKNTSGNVLDLTGWQLRDTLGKSFIFPESTKIAANKTTVFPVKVTNLNTSSGVNIFTPTNSLVGTSIVAKSYSGNSKSTSVKKVEEPILEAGVVLGATDTALDSEKSETNESGQGLVWILAFIVLLLVAVIVVMFLRREEVSEDAYELIDE